MFVCLYNAVYNDLPASTGSRKFVAKCAILSFSLHTITGLQLQRVFMIIIASQNMIYHCYTTTAS